VKITAPSRPGLGADRKRAKGGCTTKINKSAKIKTSVGSGSSSFVFSEFTKMLSDVENFSVRKILQLFSARFNVAYLRPSLDRD
jgi:hypothetical protein